MRIHPSDVAIATTVVIPSNARDLQVRSRDCRSLAPLGMTRWAALGMTVVLIAACAKSDSVATAASNGDVDSAASSITAAALLQHIKDLSADSMEGRAPGTP